MITHRQLLGHLAGGTQGPVHRGIAHRVRLGAAVEVELHDGQRDPTADPITARA
jgi:hypothetical protein